MRVCVRVFSVGFGPGLDSMSPARSRRSASHVAGTHGWLPQKTGRPGLRRGGVGGYNLQCSPEQSPRLWHTNHEQAVSVWFSRNCSLLLLKVLHFTSNKKCINNFMIDDISCLLVHSSDCPSSR